jgi:hypothetical protein
VPDVGLIGEHLLEVRPTDHPFAADLSAGRRPSRTHRRTVEGFIPSVWAISGRVRSWSSTICTC